MSELCVEEREKRKNLSISFRFRACPKLIINIVDSTDCTSTYTLGFGTAQPDETNRMEEERKKNVVKWARNGRYCRSWEGRRYAAEFEKKKQEAISSSIRTPSHHRPHLRRLNWVRLLHVYDFISIIAFFSHITPSSTHWLRRYQVYSIFHIREMSDILHNIHRHKTRNNITMSSPLQLGLHACTSRNTNRHRTWVIPVKHKYPNCSSEAICWSFAIFTLSDIWKFVFTLMGVKLDLNWTFMRSPMDLAL